MDWDCVLKLRDLVVFSKFNLLIGLFDLLNIWDSCVIFVGILWNCVMVVKYCKLVLIDWVLLLVVIDLESIG